MDMTKFVGEDYVRADTVRNKPLVVRILNVKMGQFDRPELIFNNEQIMTVNATNTRILVKAFGADSDGWIGKQIKLKLGKVTYQGNEIESVMVEPIDEEKPRKKTVVKMSEDEINELDEDGFENVVRKYDLEIDLSEYNTWTKKRNAVLEAMADKDLIAPQVRGKPFDDDIDL
jgi:hypothetical protein